MTREPLTPAANSWQVDWDRWDGGWDGMVDGMGWDGNGWEEWILACLASIYWMDGPNMDQWLGHQTKRHGPWPQEY